MAKTVFSMNLVNLRTYNNLGNLNQTKELYKDLKAYIKNYDFEPLHTYIDAEFHGEFIFGRFRTIRIHLDDFNSEKIKSDSF